MPDRPTTRLRVTSLEDRLTPAAGLATDWVVSTGYGRDDRQTPSLVAQPDGHLIVLDGGGRQVTRYNANGATDTTFAAAGTLAGLFHGATISLDVAASGPGGELTLVGRLLTGPDTYSTLAVRLHADGTPDAGFGTNGVVRLGGESSHATHAVAVAKDGSAIVTLDTGEVSVTAVRLTPAGAVDPTFGVGGRFNYTPPPSPGTSRVWVRGLAAAPDGGALVLGTQSELDADRRGPSVPLVLKFTSAGVLDPCFDGDGVLTLPDRASSLGLAVQPDGKALLALTASLPSPLAIEVVRLNPDGTIDASFAGGQASVFPADGSSGSASLALLADGRVAVTSYLYNAHAAGVAVLNPDGTPDDTFADGSGVGAIDYVAGRVISVSDVAVSGNRVAVLSQLEAAGGATPTAGSNSAWPC